MAQVRSHCQPFLRKNKDDGQQFWSTCIETSKQILEAFALASYSVITCFRCTNRPRKNSVVKNGFIQRHAYDDPQTNPTLRLLKYPCGEKTSISEPVRAGAHTDYGSITLFQKDVPGLEVQASRTEWISAPIIEGTISAASRCSLRICDERSGCRSAAVYIGLLGLRIS
ncbi:hypothetical protein VTP01DRAFT_7460 [Rhizomucor pusillus]|uniref:uncharacterized protein n=1 Tax=Rhizomucor pusillus TaxID=4840 RepID=UPI003743A70D